MYFGVTICFGNTFEDSRFGMICICKKFEDNKDGILFVIEQGTKTYRQFKRHKDTVLHEETGHVTSHEAIQSTDELTQQVVHNNVGEAAVRHRNKRKGSEEWKRNIRKKRINLGQEYMKTTGEIESAKSHPNNPCSNCALKSTEKMSEDDREELHTEFWKLGDKKKARVALDKCVRAPNNMPSPEERDMHTPHNKSKPESVFHMEAHIVSFPLVPAHWCRKDTKLVNTESTLNKENMYQLNVEYCAETQIKQLSKYAATITANFDLQAVLYCPLEHSKPVFYKRKFVVYNFTVYEVAKKQGHCFLWDESNVKRGANEIATCLQKFISNLPPTCKTLILYTDCCPGQNRNDIVAKSPNT
ncbi:hypothetical protein PR048_026979 [Dryococelus australis]|uniref:Uncharacterized protein n=1 Tax=Dryococelus australis TaxID=614101 RepID=A0ABQ9GMT0_9NEOP|nr:hypothetical protein PR048_026979 [Dryococelus australis]